MTALVLAVAASLLLAAPPQAVPRDTSTHPLPLARGVAPDTVTVGDRFRSYLRVTLPPGARAEFAPLAADDSLQLVDSVRVLPQSGGAVAAVYAMAAWVAGEPLGALATVTVTLPTGERRAYRVPLRLPVVRSVLPAEGEILPKPAKGFLFLRAERPRSGWWLLAAAAALVLAGLAAWRFLRGRAAVRPLADPRAEALARLERIAATRERHAPDLLYAAITRVLREYLLRLDPRLGEDLTTSELVERLAGADAPAIDGARLAALLHQADPVKFGGALPAPGSAERFLADARAWVMENPAAARPRREAA